MEVTFTPKTERAYSVKLNFKANNNPKAVNLKVEGKGKELSVQVKPVFTMIHMLIVLSTSLGLLAAASVVTDIMALNVLPGYLLVWNS